MAYSRGNNYDDDNYERKSGAKFGQDKHNEDYVHGWKYMRNRGIVSFFAYPTSDTRTHTSKNGKDWENWLVQITVPYDFRQETYSCLFDPETKNVFINDFNFMLKPSTPNGGWAGFLD